LFIDSSLFKMQRDMQALATVVNQRSSTRLLKDAIAKADIIIARARTQEEEWNSISTDTMYYLSAIITVCREENEEGEHAISIVDGFYDPIAINLPILSFRDIADGANIQTVIKQLVARGFSVVDYNGGDEINLNIVWSGAPETEEWKRKCEDWGWTLHLPPVGSIVRFD
jgi:hypothetical protein